ncbi:acyl-CoA-binding protein [Flavobacterium sp. SUN052]|uniref:acyl-CoA-binding protein n=1 Tax=Flavobacterium sp. SUN052 TaxID=3002441 RepID=UPI00237D60A3|nr:acyl-CoA-binding protein [Flavobacterium sp. SUN052]MEC4005680.1 acyl-CoA-binding protein [Flavobacterium sp. SUN052]
MQEKELDSRFEEAVELANTMTQAELPQDVQLRLYALYKQSTHGTITSRIYPNYDLRNAFKMNAWMQISHLTQEECKELYIEAINSIAKKK